MRDSKSDQENAGCPTARAKEDAFFKLYGSLKDEFRKLGGGEAFLRKERNRFYGQVGKWRKEKG